MVRAMAILLLYVSPLWAGWPDSRVVKLADGGSGSFIRIGDATMILSCAHRTASVSVAVGERVGYQCGDDSQGMATVIAVYPHDPQSKPFKDAAIYTIDRRPPAGIEPFTLTARETPSGSKVWVVGFPAPAMSFRSRVTRTLGYDGTLWLAGSSTPGESGGPIVNEQGEIVGTLTGCTDDGRSLACPVTVLYELCREVETTWCQNGRCGQQQRPPQMVPVQPAPQPAPPRPPAVDWSAKFERQESTIAELQLKLEATIKTLGEIKGCRCDDCLAKCDAKIAAAIAGIKIPQPKPPEPLNYDALATEMQQRLKHSAAITLLDGSKKTQTKPLGEPLEFIQHSRGLK